ncbi:MAG: exosortase U, partial [Planctomycetaceae bacterium]|nr:exosortase U [Planctomycetaceae bacterium]
GDLVLEPTDLPLEIGEWKQTGFSPPRPVEQLPQGQYWSSHTWTYQAGARQAIAAFDQANWIDWHELTVCYELSGWTLLQRLVVAPEQPEDQSWEYIVSTFQKDDGQKAMMLYSMFFEDGTPLLPPEIRTQSRQALIEEEQRTFAERMRHRIDYAARRNASAATQHGRALQCQVFLTMDNEDPQQLLQSTTELHLVTRQLFLMCWQDRNRNPVANGDESGRELQHP